jgi:hypothetical protein
MSEINVIQDKYLDGPPQKIGTHGKDPIYQCKTKGGLYLIIKKGDNGKGFDVMATGPHRAVARHIAMKNFEDIVFTELSKSDHVGIENFALIIPEYEALTARLQNLMEKK